MEKKSNAIESKSTNYRAESPTHVSDPYKNIHKTVFCVPYMQRQCRFGNSCKFAHRDKELLERSESIPPCPYGQSCWTLGCPYPHADKEPRWIKIESLSHSMLDAMPEGYECILKY